MSEVAAVVVAAGRGLRAGGEVPKQFRRIGGETMLSRTLSALLQVPRLAAVQPVIHPDDRDRYASIGHDARILAPVFGGATRQASVRAGLEALAARKPAIVLVHDAARPFASAAADRARDRRRRNNRRGGAGTAGCRHRQDRGCRGPRHAHARARRAAPDPDPAGFRLRAADGRASARGGARPRRLHRRRRARRMGRHDGRRVPR